MPGLSPSEYQPPNQLEVSPEEIRVCFGSHFPLLEYLRLRRYLYYQGFGIDACFRFKRRQISSYEKDPKLGPGFAYVVAWKPYHQYLLSKDHQSELK